MYVYAIYITLGCSQNNAQNMALCSVILSAIRL